MNWTLLLAALALGVAASPHCALMCGAPCAAVTGGCSRPLASFHVGRLASYMAGGAAAAASVQVLGSWSAMTPSLRPMWTLLHLALLGLGLWWLASGRHPLWLQRRVSQVAPIRFIGARSPSLRSGIAGLVWVAWPCAALQSALLLAALANDALGGALVMGAFALASMPALAAAPWAWARWQARRGGTAVDPSGIAALGYRVAGAGLVLASGWALAAGIWPPFAAWCATL
jgi:sulfite exporter TauE/SafE